MVAYLKKLFITQTNSTWLQMFRHLFVGGISFVADYGILFVLTEFCSMNCYLAAALGFCAGVVVNYIFTKLLVFQQEMEDKKREWTIFFLICLAGLIFTEGIMYGLTDLLGVHYLISKIVATVIVFLWNFFGKKFILYKDYMASE